MKVTKSYLMQIIKEELQAVLREESVSPDFEVGQIWVLKGQESETTDKFAIEIMYVLPNSVNVKFLGDAFEKKNFKMGSTTMFTKDSVKRTFNKREIDFDQMTGHNKHLYTIHLDEKKKLVNEGIEEYIMNLGVDPHIEGEVLSLLSQIENEEEKEELKSRINALDNDVEKIEEYLIGWVGRTQNMLDYDSSSLYEGLRYHIENKTPLTENVYRVGSDAYFNLIKEARVQYKKGNYTPLNEEEKEMLESDLGEWATFRGERVPLDFPMYTETLYERKKKKKKKKDPPIGKPTKNTGGGKKYKVFVRNPKTGKIKKITYGDSQGGLKGNWNSAEARKSFASRHRCAEKKDRTKAGYWACRAHKDFGTNVPGRFW